MSNTTTRIDHSGHNHPLTPAARELCRKAMRNGSGPIKVTKKSGKVKAKATKPSTASDLGVTPAKPAKKVKKTVKQIVEAQGIRYPSDEERDAALQATRDEVEARITIERVEDDGVQAEAIAYDGIVVGSAKGSKVVHRLVANEVDNTVHLRCTNQVTKYTPVIAADASVVTCKNCLKADA